MVSINDENFQHIFIPFFFLDGLDLRKAAYECMYTLLDSTYRLTDKRKMFNEFFFLFFSMSR